MMKQTTKKLLWVFAVTLGLGFLLHFLYEWFPNSLTALFSPVKESLWEHVKIVFWPLFLAALVVSGQDSAVRAGWLLSAVVTSGLMLAAAYVYHVLLRGEGMAFDIALYVAAIILGFFLPRWLTPLGERPTWRRAAWVLTAILAAMLVGFTFRPPEGILFADLSGGVRTFLTIPV
jgi:hypothetical protein